MVLLRHPPGTPHDSLGGAPSEQPNVPAAVAEWAPRGIRLSPAGPREDYRLWFFNSGGRLYPNLLPDYVFRTAFFGGHLTKLHFSYQVQRGDNTCYLWSLYFLCHWQPPPDNVPPGHRRHDDVLPRQRDGYSFIIQSMLQGWLLTAPRREWLCAFLATQPEDEKEKQYTFDCQELVNHMLTWSAATMDLATDAFEFGLTKAVQSWQRRRRQAT